MIVERRPEGLYIELDLHEDVDTPKHNELFDLLVRSEQSLITFWSAYVDVLHVARQTPGGLDDRGCYESMSSYEMALSRAYLRAVNDETFPQSDLLAMTQTLFSALLLNIAELHIKE